MEIKEKIQLKTTGKPSNVSDPRGPLICTHAKESSRNPQCLWSLLHVREQPALERANSILLTNPASLKGDHTLHF